MPAKPNARNWNDVQTAIATVSIVTTLGLWNLFATPAKAQAQTAEPEVPPTEPALDFEMAPGSIPLPTPMPQVKIMFTPGATLQPVTSVQQPQTTKKKKNNNGGGGGGGGTVTHTKTS